MTFNSPSVSLVSSHSAMGSHKVPITFAGLLYDRFQPLQSGEVVPEGIDLNFLALHHPRDIFDRMAGGKEFNASELSYIFADTRWVSAILLRYQCFHPEPFGMDTLQ